MFARGSACVLAAMVFGTAAPLAAQSDDEGFAERERALARELAEQQDSTDRRVREQAERQREREAQEREQLAQYREQAAQYAEQQRELAREFEAQQREFESQRRDLAAQQEASARELARELAKARAELQVSASEIARLSAQLSGRAMNDVMRNVQNSRRLVMLGQRSMLGINVEDADGGVRVRGVSPNGPAAAAGVVVGDIIVAIDGVEVDGDAGTSTFLSHMADVEPGDDVELRIRRGNEARIVVVEAAENTSQPFVSIFPRGARTSADPVRVFGPGGFAFAGFGGPWSDVELVSLTPGLGEYFGTEDGLLVVRAGDMGELGLRDGDVILDIGGREPQSPEHATRIFSTFEPGESVPLSIMRQRRRETLTITVPEQPRIGWNVIGPKPF